MFKVSTNRKIEKVEKDLKIFKIIWNFIWKISENFNYKIFFNSINLNKFWKFKFQILNRYLLIAILYLYIY